MKNFPHTYDDTKDVLLIHGLLDEAELTFLANRVYWSETMYLTLDNKPLKHLENNDMLCKIQISDLNLFIISSIENFRIRLDDPCSIGKLSEALEYIYSQTSLDKNPC